jgi:cytoskeletal protein CcmA (bactofilin family)
MNPSVLTSVRVDVLLLLTFSVVILGLVVLLPFPAYAAEERLVGDVVVGPRGVEHDVSTGAGDLEVHGVVEDDVHSGFGDVLVIGEVKGDIEAGFGDVRIEGPVDGDVRAEFGDVYVNSLVKGDVNVGWGDVDLGPDAEISGNLECEGCEITGNSDAVKGDMMARGMALDLDESHGPGIIGFVGWLFAALAFAACAVLAAVVAPRPLASAASRAEESPGRSFVYGLVSLPVFFVLCVVLAVTIIGIPLLLLLVPAYLALLFVGALVAAFFIGTRILMFTGRYRVGNALAAVVGAMILAATTLIPVLGNLLLYALTLLGTGAIILALFSRRRPRASHPSYEAYVRDRSGG